MAVFVAGSGGVSKETLTTELNARTIVKKDITVQTSSFVTDSTYSDYPYKADFTISGFAGNYTDYVPDVYFAPPWTDNGVLASFCESVSGGIRLYARSLPDSAVTVKTVKLIKGV